MRKFYQYTERAILARAPSHRIEILLFVLLKQRNESDVIADIDIPFLHFL